MSCWLTKNDDRSSHEREDRWEHIASDLVPFSAGRAINWAALRRKSDAGVHLGVSKNHGPNFDPTVFVNDLMYLCPFDKYWPGISTKLRLRPSRILSVSLQ